MAYLVNAYPKISHSFIRTEIAALESLGLEVARFTIRRSDLHALDPADHIEAERTTALLDRNLAGLFSAMFKRSRTAPLATMGAFGDALKRGGSRDWLRACAYFAEAAGLVELMRSQGVRHVHAHFGTNPAAVVRLAARMAPITYSFTVHGPDEFDAPRELDLAGKIADAAFVVAISNYGRGQLMRWAEPSDWHKIKVVRCAVSPVFLEDEDRRHPRPRANRFVCIARLSPQKGLPLLLDAVAAVAAEREIMVDIIGDGDGRVQIERQIKQLGLENSVRLLGWKPPEDVRRHLEDCRALLVPSFAEGLPVVLMEALALGRPVIATAIAGIPELIDSKTGWLISSGSVREMVNALEAALDAAPHRLRSMGEVGSMRVRSAHHPERNARLLAEHFAPHV